MKNFTITQTLSLQKVSDALCSALNDGLNCWCRISGVLAPSIWEFESNPKSESGHYTQDYPLNPGGALLIVDEESDDDGVLTLDWNALQKGLTVMAERYPKTFSNIITGNADANTGDMLLQCSLFGKVIYG